MGATRIIILAVAAGAAVMTLLLMRGFLSDAGSQAEAQPGSNLATVDVLVASETLTRGSRVNSQKLSWQAWPQNAVGSSYITRTSNPDAMATFENAIVRIDMAESEPVTANKLITLEGTGFMAAIIEPGKRAISTEISPETGAGGFILPNDYVDVIVAEGKEGQNGEDYVISRTILQNVRVLAIDQTFQQSEQGDQVVVGSTATLELLPHQAEQLSLAQSVGELSLALRSLADSGPNVQQVVTKNASKSSNMRVFRYGNESNVFVEGAE